MILLKKNYVDLIPTDLLITKLQNDQPLTPSDIEIHLTQENGSQFWHTLQQHLINLVSNKAMSVEDAGSRLVPSLIGTSRTELSVENSSRARDKVLSLDFKTAVDPSLALLEIVEMTKKILI